MHHLLIRHKVADFAKWKPFYDAHEPVRHKAGLKEKLLSRNLNDPSEIVLLFEAADIQKAKDFAASPELRQTMEKAGVVDAPTIWYLM
jgi:hypothetical protein